MTDVLSTAAKAAGTSASRARLPVEVNAERLTAERLTVEHRGRRVLDGVDASFVAGQLAFLVGPNGAGKSTLLRALAGLDAPSLAHARRVAWMPAETQVAFAFSARAVVLMGRYPWHLGNPGVVDRRRAEAALAAVGAAPLADVAVTRLSSGERQRVQIARMFASDATFLLLDEPFANLDPAASLHLIDALQREATAGRGVVVCTHDLDLAWRHGEHLLCLDRGRVAAAGLPRSALTATLLATVFGLVARQLSDERGGTRLVFDVASAKAPGSR